MNIGFDAKRAFNNTTGLGNYSRTLISGLLQYYPENHYHLFTSAAKVDFLKTPTSNVTVHLPRTMLHKQFPWYWRSFYLNREQKKSHLDLYHGLSAELPFGNATGNVKQVVTIHDLIFLKYPQHYLFADRIIYESKLRNSCKIADRIITISEQTKKDLIDILPDAENKISVVYQSCDARFWNKVSEDNTWVIRKKLQLPDKYILTVGAISERKNLMNLVKAFYEIAATTPAHLVIAGDGKAYKKLLQQLIIRLKLQDRVHIISNISNDDLPAVYQMADFFVYPSVYEGFGIPIIEALSSEVPVITTKGGCFAEAGGTAAEYVDTSNVQELTQATLNVLQDEELRKKMIHAGLQHVQKFTLEKTSKELMEIYEQTAQ